MSHESQKADQIAFHFYTKLFYVVNQARTTTEPRQTRLDRWFNLETPDSDLFVKEARDPYRAISLDVPPPLEIQVLLTIPDLTHNQVLVYLAPDSSRIRVHPTPHHVLLESYTLDFVPARDGPTDVPLPTIYKHGIPLFRSLFTLLRILPTWKLHKRLRRRGASGPSLAITLKVRTGDDPNILTFDTPSLPLSSQTHTFPPVPHPMGTLALSATYLTSPAFQLDELESLLSSRFLSLDERPFIPTLVKNQYRDSSISRSHSQSASNSRPLSRSPPAANPSTAANPQSSRSTSTSPPSHAHTPHSSSPLSLAYADRFLLPNPRTSSVPSSTSGPGPGRGIPLPLPVRQSASGSGSGPNSIPRHASGSFPNTTTITAARPSGLETTRARLLLESSHRSSPPSPIRSFSPTGSFFGAASSSSHSHSHSPANANTSMQSHSRTHSLTNQNAHTLPGALPFPQSIPQLPPTNQNSPNASANPARRPHINPVYPFPFKSNTLSSSSSGVSSHQAGTSSSPQSLYTGVGAAGTPSGLGDRAGLADRERELERDRRSFDSGSGAEARLTGPPRDDGGTDVPVAVTATNVMGAGMTGAVADVGAGTAGTGTGAGTPRKRYSSSFGHRYAPALGAPGSVGSTGSGAGSGAGSGGEGSGERELFRSRGRDKGRDTEREKATSTSTNAFFASGHHSHADDDEISIFVQDIDMRKPLVGRRQQQEREEETMDSGGREREGGQGGSSSSVKAEGVVQGRGWDQDRGRDEVAGQAGYESDRGRGSRGGFRADIGRWASGAELVVDESGGARASMGSPSAGVILTSEKEVDERLRRMNETFLRSLEGFGGGRQGSGNRGGVGAGGQSRSGDGRRKEKAHVRPNSGERRRSVSTGAGGLPLARDREIEGDKIREGGSSREAERELGRGKSQNEIGHGRSNSSPRAPCPAIFAQPAIYSPYEERRKSGLEEVIGQLELDDNQHGRSRT